MEITVGKEKATIRRLFGQVVVIRFKGEEANIDIGNGWKKLSGTMGEDTINKIKKALEQA